MDNKCRKIIVVIGCTLAIILFSYLIKYILEVFSISIPCLFHYFTGLYCPGCGMTRAVYSLMEFNFITAFRNNFLLVFLIPVSVYYVCKFIYYFVNGKNLKDRLFFNQKIVMILLVITVLFGVLRNFDYFYFLQPI